MQPTLFNLQRNNLLLVLLHLNAFEQNLLFDFIRTLHLAHETFDVWIRPNSERKWWNTKYYVIYWHVNWFKLFPPGVSYRKSKITKKGCFWPISRRDSQVKQGETWAEGMLSLGCSPFLDALLWQVRSSVCRQRKITKGAVLTVLERVIYSERKWWNTKYYVMAAMHETCMYTRYKTELEKHLKIGKQQTN